MTDLALATIEDVKANGWAPLAVLDARIAQAEELDEAMRFNASLATLAYTRGRLDEARFCRDLLSGRACSEESVDAGHAARHPREEPS